LQTQAFAILAEAYQKTPKLDLWDIQAVAQTLANTLFTWLLHPTLQRADGKKRAFTHMASWDVRVDLAVCCLCRDLLFLV